MKNRCLFSCLAVMTCVMGLYAQNPVIQNQFTADPTARVFNGKIYMYPSHDIPSPIESLKEWFCMGDYHVFSSDNLVDWTDHGVILDQNQVPWVKPNSYTMWAPDCVEKDGKYYFYFPAGPKGTRGFSVGVAIAQHPEGPFMPMQNHIQGVMGIDPCVLIDDDGQSYLYWSGGGMFASKLQDNMLELASQPKRLEGMPTGGGLMEGPFAFKHNGKYYLTFPWVREKNGTEALVYCMSDNPLGPFEYKGVIMEEHASGCWTNHHSIVEYKNQWYLFYHHNDFSPQFDKNRSARIDSLRFNPDGTIQQVIPTLRGVGITCANSQIQIDRYSSINSKASIAFLNEDNKFEGWKTIFKKSGAAVQYNKVDFGTAPIQAVKVRVKSASGGILQVKTGGKKGNLIATIKVPRCKNWIIIDTPVKNVPNGIQDLYVTLKSGSMEVDWLGFNGTSWAKDAF